MFEKKLKELSEEIIIVKNKFEPVIGASLLALEKSGIIITEEILKNVEISQKRYS